MSQVPRRTVRSLTVSAVLACAGVAASATPASATAYEQISRASGPNGAAVFSNRNAPVFASDTGTVGLVEVLPFENFNRTYRSSTRKRDIVTDLTTVVGNPFAGYGPPSAQAERIVGFTKDEQTMLVGLAKPSGSYGYYLRPVDRSTPDRLVDRAAAEDQGFHGAAISGDGSTVVTEHVDGADPGLHVVSTVTGARTVYPEITDQRLDHFSISDDGKVIAGQDGDDSFMIVRGVVTKFSRETAAVSGDGSVVVEPTYDGTVVLHRTADGSTTTIPTPLGGVNRIIWVSADGNRIAFAPSSTSGNAMVLTVSSRTWAKFGTAFSPSLEADAQISRNGRYAVVEYGAQSVGYYTGGVSQAALVDLAAKDLPGDQEGLSASSYLRVEPPVSQYCRDSAMLASFGRPAPWAPLPRKGELTVTIDGKRAFHGTFTSDSPGVRIPFEPTDRSVTTRVKVVDHVGKTLTTEQTIPVRCLSVE